MPQLSFLSLFACALASMIIGSIWYGPLFGKRFMAASGMDKWSKAQQDAAKKQMGVSYALQFIASLVMFFVLASMIGYNGITTPVQGMIFASFVWLGFVVPVKLGDAIWGGNKTLFWLGIGNMLLTLLAAGAILGAWN